MNSFFLSVLTTITLCSTNVYSFSRPFKKKSYKVNSKISENKIISVSPGGIKGLYYLGSLFYIKEKGLSLAWDQYLQEVYLERPHLSY